MSSSVSNAAALALQESGWEELRKEAMKVEADLDVKLSSYARIASSSSTSLRPSSGYADGGSPVGASRSWKSMEMEIQSQLEKLEIINEAMRRCVESVSPTTSVTQKLARHKDILHEFMQEFRRTKGNMNSLLEHAELLSSARNGSVDSKATGNMTPNANLLRERGSIQTSIIHIDEVINQAQETRTTLATQRGLIGDIQGKVKQLGEKFPVIRGLIGAIRRKRSRDTLILSSVIAACTFFLIIYWLAK